jgi:hypothetical protein
MKALHEIHNGDFVVFKVDPRKEVEGDEIVERKIRKDYVTLRKLVIACFKYTNPIIEWKDGDKTVVSSADLRSISKSPKLEFWFTHKKTRMFLALKTLVFTDMLTSKEEEIKYHQIQKIIIPSNVFDKITSDWESYGFTF